MISKADKKKIIKVLGHRYSKPIQQELNDSKELNKNGDTYSDRQIVNVMNGTPHQIIEAAIYRTVEKKAKEISERKKLLKAL